MDFKGKYLVIILGPTGVGKSAAGLKLAKKFEGEIINCDSMQVYRGFDIGTDKLLRQEREGIPHYLLDISDPDSQFTAADFAKLALDTANSILDRKKLPIVVGGTGLYLKVLLDGLFPGPSRSTRLRQRLEKQVARKGLESLAEKLKKVDPEYYQTVGKNDKMRIIRGLEVYHITKKPISKHFLKTKSFVEGFNAIKIGLTLPRAELYRKIEERVDSMFRKGIVREVEGLLEQGTKEASPPFRALGYEYVLAHLKKGMPLEQAISLTKRDTRRYAKRQLTWFKKMEGIQWFSPLDFASLASFVESRLR